MGQQWCYWQMREREASHLPTSMNLEDFGMFAWKKLFLMHSSCQLVPVTSWRHLCGAEHGSVCYLLLKGIPFSHSLKWGSAATSASGLVCVLLGSDMFCADDVDFGWVLHSYGEGLRIFRSREAACGFTPGQCTARGLCLHWDQSQAAAGSAFWGLRTASSTHHFPKETWPWVNIVITAFKTLHVCDGDWVSPWENGETPSMGTCTPRLAFLPSHGCANTLIHWIMDSASHPIKLCPHFGQCPCPWMLVFIEPRLTLRHNLDFGVRRKTH